ncbi:guard cell S-type anion channel SLAC1 [Aristolochia californica]|uniref:guard cell S-type anion channel SLAC1 n=1 Tax=Aristolochia californica TaxID=171875 RepID=UPI0035D8B4F4
MAAKATSDPNSPPQVHFVDIHQVVPEEEPAAVDDHRRLFNKPWKFKDQRRSQRSFSRQVSLETGISVLDRETKAGKDERKILRSGRSLGGFTSANGGSAEGRKGDFSIFRTKSAIHKQNSMLPIRKDADGDAVKADLMGVLDDSTKQSVPINAGRYFAALRGPELDQIRESEDILLPKDEKWPFLLRFPIGCFGICLGLSSQSILWRTLASSPATQFLHITPIINLVLWLLALAVLLSVSLTYALKCGFYLEAVRREYYHPVRINFFFAPWIVCLFLAIGVPPALVAHDRLHPAVWCIFMTPIFFLELKIYGQWLSGGRRRLSKVANPSSHLSVVGNFVGAILACKVGWKEPAKFLWAVGFAHYLVVFVTLYQRLPSSEALPKELHPVYSMFIAAPSAASIAWEAIYGEFDGLSRTCYFIALFLYISLVVRLNFFWGFKFSVAWWSYTFPMTTASLATIKYAEQVPCVLSKVLAVALSLMSSTVVSVLFVCTLLHAFVWKSLFPNDLAIAITKKKIMHHGKEKKAAKKPYDIRRWTKQSPLSLVSAITKNGGKGC